MQVKIRPARPDEAEKLTDLVLRAKASWGYPEAWMLEWAPKLSISRQYISQSSVFVADFAGTLAGVIAVEEDPEPEIAHLWVAPECQRLGLGGQLVDHVLHHAREKKWTSLRIEADPFAVPFYENAGAHKIGEVAAPVCGEERFLPVMSLPVSPS
ncbi:MAG: ribosomal protein S18 acetylase RimI-like enzyme [Candidatus Krumholzibacteriia bacterium]|jgi:ribosomal protein S18 acetylase RimI-like enzyme